MSNHKPETKAKAESVMTGAAPGFDVSAFFKGVSAADTGREQIEYIPLDLIDQNPENFYSLEGVNELAGNIEAIGLQQPLRLRPTQGGRYMVISGHRRRAACLLIRDGGNDMFAKGVPSIVERSADSPAVIKFKLLMANKDTRKMTSSDQNRQAEELEDTLRELENEGFEFPGRLRDWVAELSGMSRSKLARLKVIREKLAPDLKTIYYDTNQLDETAAYELARLDVSTQRWAMDVYTSTHHGSPSIGSAWVREFDADRKRIEDLKCKKVAGGGPCCYQRELIEHLYRKGYRGYEGCGSGCCQNCSHMEHCSNVCPRMKKEQEKLRAQNRKAKRDARDQQLAIEDARKREIEHFWFRFGQAMRRANMDENALMEASGHDRYCNQLFNWNTTAEMRDQLFDGSCGSVRPDTYLPLDRGMDLEQGRRLVALADALGCSLDYLMLRTDVPEVSAAPAPVSAADTVAAWQIGEPPRPGRYLCRLRMPGAAELHEHKLSWSDGIWTLYDEPLRDDFLVLSWWPLPEV